jgi:hypothetical protein
MRWQKTGVCALVFLGLILVGLSGGIQSQDDKRLMMIFTTSTEGELNPCG